MKEKTKEYLKHGAKNTLSITLLKLYTDVFTNLGGFDLVEKIGYKILSLVETAPKVIQIVVGIPLLLTPIVATFATIVPVTVLSTEGICYALKIASQYIKQQIEKYKENKYYEQKLKQIDKIGTQEEKTEVKTEEKKPDYSSHIVTRYAEGLMASLSSLTPKEQEFFMLKINAILTDYYAELKDYAKDYLTKETSSDNIHQSALLKLQALGERVEVFKADTHEIQKEEEPIEEKPTDLVLKL